MLKDHQFSLATVMLCILALAIGLSIPPWTIGPTIVVAAIADLYLLRTKKYRRAKYVTTIVVLVTIVRSVLIAFGIGR